MTSVEKIHASMRMGFHTKKNMQHCSEENIMLLHIIKLPSNLKTMIVLNRLYFKSYLYTNYFKCRCIQIISDL
jgi:hypothetical protein